VIFTGISDDDKSAGSRCL